MNLCTRMAHSLFPVPSLLPSRPPSQVLNPRPFHFFLNKHNQSQIFEGEGEERSESTGHMSKESTASERKGEMVVTICLFVLLFLVCFAVGLIFIVYMFVLWTFTLSGTNQGASSGKTAKGLSLAELERLGGAADGGSLAGEECAVCLEYIEAGQVARVLPDCRHTFHLLCADRWLSAHPDCPLCRAHLDPPPPPSLPEKVVVRA